MNYGRKKYFFFVSAIILLIHAWLSVTGYRPVNVARIFWYVMDFKFLENNFWQSILYFHEIPPLLSIIHFMAYKLSGGNPDIFFEIMLPLLHLFSFLIFTKIVEQFNFRFKKILIAILFLNPLLFIYFRFPFYSAFIFFQSILILYLLFVSNRSQKFKLVSITLLLCVAALQRASYSVPVIILLMFPLMKNVAWKQRLIAFSLLLMPLSLYVKNYFLFHKFSSTTITGMYFHGHINKENSKAPLARLGICRPANDYAAFINENDPLVKKYAGIEILNQNDMNNIRYIQVADGFMKEFKENFNPFYSIKYVSLGIIRFFASPSADYNYANTYFGNVPHFLYDVFDLPNYSFNNETKTTIPFSVYLLVYPFMLFYLLKNFKNLSFKIRYVLCFVLIFAALYSAVDPLESMRMRFEIEPMLYFLIFVVINHIFTKKFGPEKYSSNNETLNGKIL